MKKEKERERLFFAFHRCPTLSSLLFLNTLPFFTLTCFGADVMLVSRVVLSQFKRTDTGLYRLTTLAVSDDSSA